MRISHEAIYQALYIQGLGALRRELTACLRTGRTLRMPRGCVGLRGKNFVSPDIMISKRTTERCRATGRATSFWGSAARRSARWSSEQPA
jgi:IS30 family transposase